jgi:amino acid adenylation domain-containing protein
MEPLIGLFANTLVLRGQLAGNPSFLTLLRQVRETCLGAFSHQVLPFEKLVEALQPPRDLSRGPLVQVLFQVQSAWTAGLELPGLTAERISLDSDTAKFDLSLDVLPNGEGQLQAVFEYATDLFHASTIARMARHWSTLLRGIAHQPDARIGDLPLLDSHERRVLVSGSRIEVPALAIHRLIEAQASRTPNARAVTYEGHSLTYEQLEQRATALAKRLRARGVGPEVRVGICMDRGLDLIVAVLGVWKAGAAFVPLDPSLPRDRLDFLIADSGASLVLTDTELPPGNAHTQAVEPCADNLAYVLYTSGSTGRPKGVMVTHASLASACAAWQHTYQLQHTTTAHLQMAGFSFDVFVGDVVRALASGARLVLCPREKLLDPPALYSQLLREQIDCAEFVPSVLRGLMEYMTRRGLALPALRLLVVGSESWHPSDWHALAALVGPRTRLINSYGLTEATIDSTFAEQPGSIGHAFANTRTLVLDHYGNLAPIGVPGELHVGGAGLARGYACRPDLTAARFIPDAFGSEPGARLYRTGDLARVRADGDLELLGRIDHQIKLRGVRIEPAEIEAALCECPSVREAVVLACDDRLVAYWTPDGNAPPVTATELRTLLRSRLPAQMVPGALVRLDRLPRLSNGKVDRAAFPPNHTDSESEYVEPRTPQEHRIATIWSEVLGVPRVGATDDFFTLGGHSLLATRVISQVRSALGVEVPLRALFEEPVLSSFAALAASSTSARPPAIRVVAREAYRRGDA